MDEDRWKNIILGEITVLSRLNHPHAAPPPFVASFPITKLAADITHICMDLVSHSSSLHSSSLPSARQRGKGSTGRPLPPSCLSLSSSVGSEDPTKAKISTDLMTLPLMQGTTSSISALQQLSPEPKDHQPLSLHLGTPHPLSGFWGMSAKAVASRG